MELSELREDEIEALVKFDRSSMTVTRYGDLTASMGQEYVCIIVREDGRAFAGSGETRIQAVHKAWGTYQKFMSAPVESRHSGYWLYENAIADVELQRLKNNQEKQHG